MERNIKCDSYTNSNHLTEEVKSLEAQYNEVNIDLKKVENEIIHEHYKTSCLKANIDELKDIVEDLTNHFEKLTKRLNHVQATFDQYEHASVFYEKVIRDMEDLYFNKPENIDEIIDVTSPLGPGNVFKELGDTEKLISEQNLELQALLQELNCCNI